MSSTNTGTQENFLKAVRYAVGTHVGMRREENQDSYGIIESSAYRLYIVADGMGGVKGGAIASNLCITTVEKCFESVTHPGVNDLLRAVEKANQEVHEKGQSDATLNGMGTTFVSFLFVGTSLFVVHVGDSRAYRVRNGKIQRLTEDHTLVQELMRSGAISEQQAEHHPVSHMLTRSIGPTNEVQPDWELSKDGPIRDDVYLLCSDGLYNLVKESEILEILSKNSSEEARDKLIELANNRGGTDNITVLIVRVGEEYPVGIEDIEVFPYEDEETDQEASPEVSADEAEAESPKSEILQASLADDSEEYLNGHSPHAKHEPPREKEMESKKSPSVEEVVTPTSTKEKTYTPNFYRTYGLLLFAFVGGIGVAYLLFGMVPGEMETAEIQAPQIARVESKISEESVPKEKQKSVLPALTTMYSGSDSSAAVPNVGSSVSSTLTAARYGDGERLGPAEKASIQKRKKELAAILENLNKKIGSFDRPLSGDIAELLSASRARTEELTKKLEQNNVDLDTTARKLAVWYGRRKRLETTDSTNMATEVSVSSPDVKAKNETFEKATWDYMKEAEVLRFHPGDKEKEAQVGELVKIRAQRLKELADSVKKAIDDAVGEADHGIAELTLEKDKLASEIEDAKAETEFAKILMSSNEEAKSNLKRELILKRDGALSELDELNRLLPDAQ